MEKLSKQDYLEKAKEYAISKDGVCLSDEYVNAKTKMEWKCKDRRHLSWLADCDHMINKNRWCPECAGERAVLKNGYNQAMNYAKLRGGFVLVPKDKAIKLHTDLTWKCNNPDHKSWSAKFVTIQKGSWCPYCAGRFSKEEYLQKAKDYALSKGGTCLSSKYENQNTKLRFKCSIASHKIFISDFDRLVPLNKWCKECKPFLPEEVEKRNVYLEKAKKHAISKGGQCLSTQYINSKIKLEWQCSNLIHKTWRATYQNILGTLNRWCPECAGQFTPEEQLEKAKKYAISKGGECLSNAYEPKKKITWKCREVNHNPWQAFFHNVMTAKNSTWCPECGNSIYYKENHTRIILEFLLGFKLKKARLSWNINPETNHTLELDGYNEEHQFAFEFQGRHHFEENVYKNKSLEDVQKKDKIKNQNCLKHNVSLLLINDKKNMGTLTDHIHYVVDHLKEKNIVFNHNFEIKELLKTIDEFNNISPKNEYLKIAQDYALSKGGQCLSQAYINYSSKLIWKCNVKEHGTWEAAISIKNANSWCPQCAGKFSKNFFLEKAKKYAISKGGLCLSDEYKNNYTNLLWKCKNFHEWESPTLKIYKKNWCRQCK